MGPSTPALVVASFALGWYAAYVLLGKKSEDPPVPVDDPAVVNLKRENVALRKQVDELSRRIIETALIQDEDDEDDSEMLLKRQVGPGIARHVHSPPRTPPLY